MKTAKKVLALLLSVLMVFTMVSSSVVAVAETVPAERTQIEDVENKVTNAFDTVKGIIDGVHNLVGGILSMLGKECVFCDEVHGKSVIDKDTQEPTEPETPPSEPEVPVEPEHPTEPETPVEPEEPKEDKPTEDKIGNIFDSIGGIFDSIHSLVGNILAIFDKVCPFCDKVHGEDEGETEKPDTPEEPDEPSEPDVPDTPEEPDEPSEPDVPDTPEEPDEPDTPEEPTSEPIVLCVTQENYITKEISATLTGTWESAAGLDYIIATVTSEVDNGTAIDEPMVVVNGNSWSCNFNLKPGKNTIVIKAANVQGSTDEKTITIDYEIGEIVVPDENDIIIEDGVAYHKGVLLLYFSDDITEVNARQIIERFGGSVIGQNNFLNMYQCKFDVESYDELCGLAESIKQHEYITSVFIDEVIYNSSITISDVWNGDVTNADWSDSDVDGSNWGLEAIEIYDVWSEYGERLQENPTRVGIVDSGYNLAHEDIANINDNINVFLMGDYNSNLSDHGSHVLGTIAASPDNSVGVTGIVWNGNVYVASAGTGERSLSGAMIQDGFARTVISGAKVINFSLGCGGIETTEEADNAALYAVEPMARLIEQGYDFICVQAAGNDNGKDARLNGWFSSFREGLDISDITTLSMETLIERTIIVAAAENAYDSEKGYRLAEYSNRGSKVDVVAPGSSIYSCCWNGYGFKSGTSMAAPHVAAVASLIWSIDHDFTPGEIKNLICAVNSTTKAYGYYYDESYRMLNAKMAIANAVSYADAVGTATGCFVDAATGYAISNGVFTVHKDNADGEIVGEAVTFDASGFSLTLPAGKYVLEVKSEGYITKYATIIIEPFDALNYGDIPVSKEISNDQLRIVLSWDEYPYDLDSHLIGYDTVGNRIHVAYYDKIHFAGENDIDNDDYYYQDGEVDSDNVIVWLDVDDTSSYGPETVTIINLNDIESFTYCVHNYSNRWCVADDSGAFALADSRATVDVYQGSELLASYSVPVNRQGTVWRVFSYGSNGISRINDMTFVENPRDVQ